MKRIYAYEQTWLVDYLTKIENATPEDYQAASDLYGNVEPNKLLTYTDEGRTANIAVTGPLSRSGPSWIDMLFGFGGTAYRDIIDAISEAENSAAEKILLQMDTPGGEVMGVDTVRDAIAKCGKKVYAVNNGMVASAGYWIAAGCKKIFAREAANLTGSVGVIITAIDRAEQDKSYGIKRVTIVSRNAPNKRQDIKTKAGRDVLQDQADAIENVFMERVAEGRKKTVEYVRENFGRGGMLIARNPEGEDAQGVGMIDGLYDTETNLTGGGDSDILTAESDNTDLHESETTTPEGANSEESMNFTEFLAQNPEAKAAYDAELKAKYNAGVEAGKTEVQARIEKVAPIMASEKYDTAMKAQAQKAIKGDMSLEAFESVVAMEDMRLERENSANAQAETEGAGEGGGEQHAQGSEDGIIRSEADLMAFMGQGAE